MSQTQLEKKHCPEFQLDGAVYIMLEPMSGPGSFPASNNRRGMERDFP